MLFEVGVRGCVQGQRLLGSDGGLLAGAAGDAVFERGKVTPGTGCCFLQVIRFPEMVTSPRRWTGVECGNAPEERRLWAKGKARGVLERQTGKEKGWAAERVAETTDTERDGSEGWEDELVRGQAAEGKCMFGQSAILCGPGLTLSV